MSQQAADHPAGYCSGNLDNAAPYVDLKAALGLVDPRNLSIEEIHTSNQNFNDQLDSADVILGTKVDLVHSEDIDAFNDWVTDQTPAKVFHS